MAKRIVVADDEDLLRRLIRDFLSGQGYEVLEAEDGRQALALFEEERPDMMILDVMMPGYDGWTVCREIRKSSDVPIIMLTAKGEEIDQLFAFDLGADEYITKPFSPNILVARVKALFRRQVKSSSTNQGGLVIDEEAHEVLIDGQVVNLSPTEYDLLLYLTTNAGKALSRQQLLDRVWGYDYYGDLRTVDTHINRLRTKLGEKSDCVKTVRGYGYRFEA